MVIDERRGGAGSLLASRCPRCNHLRQAGDTAPDWQCPSCGVALNKASEFAESTQMLSIYPGHTYVPRIRRPRWRQWVLVTLVGIASATLMHWRDQKAASTRTAAAPSAPAASAAAARAAPLRPY